MLFKPSKCYLLEVFILYTIQIFWFLSQFLSFDYSAQKKILIITIQCLQTEGRGHRGCSIARLPCHFSSVTVFSCFLRLIAVLLLLFASPKIPKLLRTTLWHIYFKHKFSMHRFFNNSITFQYQISGTIFFALRFCQRNFSRLLLAEIPLCPLPSSFTGFAISPYLTFMRI